MTSKIDWSFRTSYAEFTLFGSQVRLLRGKTPLAITNGLTSLQAYLMLGRCILRNNPYLEIALTSNSKEKTLKYDNNG